MVHFVIAGRPDCPNMVQVLSAAYFLKTNLPSFEFTKLEFPFEAFDEYLIKTNRAHNWHHDSSPLIYKEVYNYGTKTPVLIGGISEFWEYCYDYYGLETMMDSEEIARLIGDNMELYQKDALEKINLWGNVFNVMVYGATSELTTVLLPQLVVIESGMEKSRLRFVLYDESLDIDNEEYFDEFIEGLRTSTGLEAVYCDNLSAGLMDAHLLIFVDDTSALKEDSDELRKYLLKMNYLAEEVNHCQKRNMRVIFAGEGMPCMIATFLARKIRVPHSHIVVVSSDLGLAYLGEMSRQLHIAAADMSAPPVWGVHGVSGFVDAGGALIKCDVCKPYARAVRVTPGSTLVHGTIHTELRFINYLSDDIKDLHEVVQERRLQIRDKLKRAPFLAKVEALRNLLMIWYGCAVDQDEPIISLGVLSDGSYDIPERIFFSQPAIQFRDGWVPYGAYPVPDDVLAKVAHCGREAAEYYSEHFDIPLDRKDYVPPSKHFCTYKALDSSAKEKALKSVLLRSRTKLATLE